MEQNSSEDSGIPKALETALNKAFPSKLSAHTKVLAHEVLRLIDILNEQYVPNFPERDDIQIHAQCLVEGQQHLPTNEELKAVYQDITKQKSIERYFFTAFIASVMDSPSQDKTQFDQYKAITFFVCIRLFIIGKHNSSIEAVCNEIRQWSLGNRDTLSNNLPCSIDSKLQQLISKLDTARVQYKENSQTQQLSRQLSRFYVPYNNSYHEKEGTKRNKRPHYGPRPTDLITNEIEDDDAEVTIIEFHEIAKVTEPWEQEEAHSEKRKSTFLVTMQENSSNGYAVQKLQAKAKINQMLKKSMSLPCDIHSASVFEIRVLIKTILEDSSIKEGARSFLLCSLLLGSSFECLSQFNFEKNAVKRKHVLPTQKLRKKISPLVNNQICQTLTLPLPVMINTSLISKNQLADVEGEATRILAEINKTHGTNITKTKVKKFLEQKLVQESTDPTIIALIKGESTVENPELSYTQLTTNQVLEVQQKFILYIENIADCKFTYVQQTPEQKPPIGSPFYDNDDVISLLLHLLQKRIQDEEDNFSSKAHNNITYHVQTIIGLSSGYRPVTGWLGTITDYDLANHSVWISDKEQLGDTKGREIILPDIAVLVLKQYLQYLQTCSLKVNPPYQKLIKRYQNAQNGNEHLFFYRTEGRYEEVTPKTIISHFDAVFPLPPNWHRHFARSLFVSENMHPDVISAWMGHTNLNSPAFSRFCSYSMADMKELARALNNKLTQLKCEVINYVK
ncbi:site-specific integrase [Parashewanella tropica]|uniref:site-specific integrase n=1 Tax=Parashewanella tropica TaxID=2547970 RepID=UPI001059FA9D|nr:site-specific integrase [Parashewanella tropica]